MSFQKALEPFAYSWSDHQALMKRKISTMSDEDLLRYLDYCDKPGQTNCWYAIYEVAKELKLLINQEIYKRDVQYRNGIIALTLKRARTYLNERVYYRVPNDLNAQYAGNIVSVGWRYITVRNAIDGRCHKVPPTAVSMRCDRESGPVLHL